MVVLSLNDYNTMKGVNFMLGYGYNYGGYGYNYGGCGDNGQWIWIVLIIFILLFICCNNRNHGNSSFCC